MEEQNEFQRVADIEKQGQQADLLVAISAGLRELKKEVMEVKKELRTAREELRNIGKLRPLRETQVESVEEKPVEQAEPTVVPPVTAGKEVEAL
jgi:hypothetical protein